MVLVAPAVKYPPLTPVLPQELSQSKSAQSIKSTTTARFRFNRILKRLLVIDNQDDRSSPNDLKKCNALPKSVEHESVLVGKISTHDKLPTNRNPSMSYVETRIEQDLSKSMPSLIEPVERLPFSEPYFSMSPKENKPCVELSTYHKHCTRQERFVNERQYHHDISAIRQTEFSQAKSSIAESIKKYYSDAINRPVENTKKEEHSIECNNKKSNSNTTLPISSSLENQIGFQYASQRSSIANNRDTRSFSSQQQFMQPLRRLQSTSKIRPIRNETKTLPQSKSSRSSTVSPSIAQRIKLLKQAIHHRNVDLPDLEPKQTNSLQVPSSPILHKDNKETQTNICPVKPSEIYHIHHHHIHSSSFLSMECRTFLSMLGTISITLFLLLELITVIF